MFLVDEHGVEEKQIKVCVPWSITSTPTEVDVSLGNASRAWNLEHAEPSQHSSILRHCPRIWQGRERIVGIVMDAQWNNSKVFIGLRRSIDCCSPAPVGVSHDCVRNILS